MVKLEFEAVGYLFSLKLTNPSKRGRETHRTLDDTEIKKKSLETPETNKIHKAPLQICMDSGMEMLCGGTVCILNTEIQKCIMNIELKPAEQHLW